ncbi:hypothetical protein H1D32_16545 [Anaerobacillus sp. CMMVII]|uniref:hypothetical protein n=1 Tax=Anaerobacillus sp. CMMVII TaxID=2755588 RepID=UPI0021B75343|nr:hypothetical protein [Anaerobacillus sp. CMMVII]MCT8139172.1 hypothetical protein [Anaerobacillus sp. CMMVII]
MVKIAPYKHLDLLTDEELIFNKPLQVFSQYLNCSKSFQDENTTRLLLEGNESLLNMNAEMLSRIITGFLERNMIKV